MGQGALTAFGAGVAMGKLDKLDERMAELRAQREQLARAMDDLKDRLEAYDSMIAGFENLRKSVPENMLVEFLEKKQITPLDLFIEGKSTTDINNESAKTPLDYAMKAKFILEEIGKPLKRGQLVREFEKRGMTVPGKDKSKNLGTIMWRHQGLIVSIPKFGYWSKDIPLPGVYDPETFVAPSADNSDGSE